MSKAGSSVSARLSAARHRRTAESPADRCVLCRAGRLISSRGASSSSRLPATKRSRDVDDVWWRLPVLDKERPCATPLARDPRQGEEKKMRQAELSEDARVILKSAAVKIAESLADLYENLGEDGDFSCTKCDCEVFQSGPSPSVFCKRSTCGHAFPRHRVF